MEKSSLCLRWGALQIPIKIHYSSSGQHLSLINEESRNELRGDGNEPGEARRGNLPLSSRLLMSRLPVSRPPVAQVSRVSRPVSALNSSSTILGVLNSSSYAKLLLLSMSKISRNGVDVPKGGRGDAGVARGVDFGVESRPGIPLVGTADRGILGISGLKLPVETELSRRDDEVGRESSNEREDRTVTKS